MSKKPVPSKKQAVSSTRSRHASWVRKMRVKLSNKITLEVCPDCGAKKRRHFACSECGKYKGRQVVNVKDTSSKPIQEIEA
jgi:large subunit ribosomal protein L32